LDGREWHVAGNYNAGQALEGERTKLFGGTLPFNATLTRWLSRICPSFASAQSRAATLHTIGTVLPCAVI
jgi:hypothetical protein